METEQTERQSLEGRLCVIANLALKYATDKIPDPSLRPNQEEYSIFLRKAWEGWKLAQVNIVEELFSIHVQRSALRELRKEANRSRHRDLSNSLDVLLRNLDYIERILRSIADSMVWTMFHQRRWIVRKLWVGRTPSVSINSIDRETTLFVDAVNEDPGAVALLTDITSLVGIGDAIVTRLGADFLAPRVVELKGGAINEIVLSLGEEYGWDPGEATPSVLQKIDEEIGPHGRSHFERVARQMARAQNFESFANYDVGVDPETGGHARNVGPELGVQTYDARLRMMMLAAGGSGSVVECVEGCLWIGVYCPETVHGLRESFLQEVTHRGGSAFYPVWNLQSVATDPRLQPLFLRDWEPKLALDIMLGNVVVLIYMDWDVFFQQVENVGIHPRWTTQKERKEITEKFYHERAFRRDGHLPVMEKDGKWFTLMGGSVGRIVNEGLSPGCLLEIIQTTFEVPDESLDQNGVKQGFRVSWAHITEDSDGEKYVQI